MVKYWEGTCYADSADNEVCFCTVCGENVAVVDGAVGCAQDDCPFEHDYTPDFYDDEENYHGLED